MITDRTQQDVEQAILIREKLAGGQQITSDEVITLQRGTITIDTLNRIEEKQHELMLLLADELYLNIHITNKAWGYNDIFTLSEFERILHNLDVLRQNFYVYSTTPATPNAEYHYTNINDIEKILVDIELILDDIKSKYRECGTFECEEAGT